MKCSKCGYVSFDNFDNCKKCGFELSEIKAKLNIPSYFVRTDTPAESPEDQEVVESIDSSTELTPESSEKLASLEEGLIIDSEQTSFGEQEDTFQFELEGEDATPELTIEEEPDETTDKEETAKQIKTGVSDAGLGDDISLELEDEEAMEEIFPLDETEKDVEDIFSKPMGIEKPDETLPLEESPIEKSILEPEQPPSETQEDTSESELEGESTAELSTEETAKAIMTDGSDDGLADDLSLMLEDDETLETELSDEDIKLSTSEIESLKEEIVLLEQEDEDTDPISLESSDIDILEFEEEVPGSSEKKSNGESEG
jgi:hypothetical protein